MKMLSLLLLASAVSVAMIFAPAQPEGEDPIRHVVAFKYKAEATEQQISEVTDAFRSLQHTIPGILDFEYGINNSPEGKNSGFTHVYLITFENEEARDIYLPHPEHQKFGELLGRLDILEDVFVIDYVPQD